MNLETTKNLRSYMMLADSVKEQFDTIVQEYSARDRLFHHGFHYAQKILITAPSGCGKSLSAEYLASRIQLPLLKANLSDFNSYHPRETKENFKILRKKVTLEPCVLFFDDIDHFYSESLFFSFMNFVDNCLQTLGLLVLSARSIRSTPMELQGKVDICVNLPMPTKEEKIQLFKATVACVQCDENIDWEALAAYCFSHREAIQVAEKAGKMAVLAGRHLIPQDFAKVLAGMD